VALVGATLEATTLGELRAGDEVNVEADLLAKHVARLMPARGAGSADGALAAWLMEAKDE